MMKYTIKEWGRYSGGMMRRWLRILDENKDFADLIFESVDGGIATASPGDFPSRKGILKKIQKGDMVLNGRTYEVRRVWPEWVCRGGGQWQTKESEKNRWGEGEESECFRSRGTGACFAYAIKLLKGKRKI